MMAPAPNRERLGPPLEGWPSLQRLAGGTVGSLARTVGELGPSAILRWPWIDDWGASPVCKARSRRKTALRLKSTLESMCVRSGLILQSTLLTISGVLITRHRGLV